MPGVAVKANDSAGGAQIAGGQTYVRAEGQLIVVLGDPVTPHGIFPHAAPVMAEGSGFVRINGIPVCREGHVASCGHPTTGRAWIRIE